MVKVEAKCCFAESATAYMKKNWSDGGICKHAFTIGAKERGKWDSLFIQKRLVGNK